jgi:hypothetical protein
MSYTERSDPNDFRWLRSLASVCRAWVNPVRTAFWEEVALFEIRELVVLARAVEDTSAKPAHIRRLYLMFNDYRTYNPSYFQAVAEEASRFLFIILRRLSVHLDVLHLNFDNGQPVCNRILHRSLHAACEDHTFSIHVTTLKIQNPSNLLGRITFVHNVVLMVDCMLRQVNGPISSMKLESLVLQMKFSGCTPSAGMLTAARAVTDMLRPACETLLSLTLDLYEYDEYTPGILRTAAMKYVLSLNGASTSVLNLRAKPFYPEAIAQELAEANVFPPYPMLQCLHLDEIGVCPFFVSYAVMDCGSYT